MEFLFAEFIDLVIMKIMKSILMAFIGLPCTMILMPLNYLKDALEKKLDQDFLWYIPYGLVYLVGFPFHLILTFLG